MSRIITLFLALLLAFSNISLAQKQPFKEWHLMDEGTDSVHGISLDKTYDFLKGKKSKPTVVAVIDSGIDTTQEDLKNILWRNPKEIPGNGVDDDHNGYVDDVYGWNFLGGKDGRNIKTESTEAARVYHRYKTKFAGRDTALVQRSATEKEEFELWKQAADLLKIRTEDQTELMFLEMAFKAVKKQEKILQADMKRDTFTVNDVEKYATVNPLAQKAKNSYLTFMRLTQIESDETNVSTFSQLDEYIEQKKKMQEAKDIAPVNQRKDIIKDDYNNINDRFYGNADVMGPTPLHGTHVSGIIAAQRNNGIGADGVADNVKIMMVRAVPDGDEYDKDIALAIKYAVDNGARVINMSFGKGISPEKKWVDEAVKYAESKDVLLVHAAGNDGANVDSVGNYPNAQLKAIGRNASNFITVGAGSDPKITEDMVADFSNYGSHTVDVFAPGVKIFSTLPGGDKYGFLKGTSMASPVVAGLAALIRSYYPALSARQVKLAIEKSVINDTAFKITKPGSKEVTVMKDLCISGGFINAYTAVKMAAAMKPEVAEIKNLPSKKQPLPKSTFKGKLSKA